MSENTLVENMGTDPAGETANQAQQSKTFTQEEVNAILARTKTQIEKKFQSKYEDLGDPDELRQIKSDWQKRQEEQQFKRGEFEKILREKSEKFEAEIQKRDSVIKDYKINTPLLSAAAQFRAVNAEQVKSLLSSNVRLNTEGEVEVVDAKGTVRYRDNGTPLAVEDLVREFLDSNPHFVAPTPATTNSRSNVADVKSTKIDISKLDMTKPADRKLYAEYRKTSGLA